jgi:hypothetical protein
MSGLTCAIASIIVFAASSSLSADVGTISSIAVLATGTVVGVASSSGAQTFVTLESGATIRERADGGAMHSIGIESLVTGEPVTVLLDRAGRGREVDASYTLVDTRAVAVQDGDFVGTDGLVRKLVGAAATSASIPLGAYVEMKTDPSTGAAFDMVVANHPFARAAAQSSVAVTFDVRVPVNTPPSSTIYIATNAQTWTANAIRMTPEPGNVWTATVDLAAGTVLQYKYTRGSWSTGEVDSAGSVIQSRTLTIAPGVKAQAQSDVVARWADLPT